MLTSNHVLAKEELLQKLQREEERHMATLAGVDDLRVQLETCKRDLDKAENERAAAMASRTQVEALRVLLSEKEVQMLDLTSELSQRERELARLKDRVKAVSTWNCGEREPFSQSSSMSDVPCSCTLTYHGTNTAIAETASPSRTSEPFAQAAAVPSSGQQTKFLLVRPYLALPNANSE